MTTNSDPLALVEEMEREVSLRPRHRWMSVRLTDVAALCAAVREAREDALMLARLASDPPYFYNPVHVWKAKAIRDRILTEADAARTPGAPSR